MVEHSKTVSSRLDREHRRIIYILRTRENMSARGVGQEQRTMTCLLRRTWRKTVKLSARGWIGTHKDHQHPEDMEGHHETVSLRFRTHTEQSRTN